MPDEEQPTYRFRWINIDLDRYIEERLAAANNLRGEAVTLRTKADIIEEEAYKLKSSLELVVGDDDEG